MLQISINSSLLDIYEDTALSIELNSTLYLGEDVDVMPGSFTFPFDVPLSPKNNATLNYPHAYDNPASFLTDAPCEISFEGTLLFKGFASVREASNFRAKIEVIFNPFKAIKDTPMNELDMGTWDFPNSSGFQVNAFLTDTVSTR